MISLYYLFFLLCLLVINHIYFYLVIIWLFFMLYKMFMMNIRQLWGSDDNWENKPDEWIWPLRIVTSQTISLFCFSFIICRKKSSFGELMNISKKSRLRVSCNFWRRIKEKDENVTGVLLKIKCFAILTTKY